MNYILVILVEDKKIKNMTPLLLTDGYKLSHREQYPVDTEVVYSNWTPRKSRLGGVNHIVNFGTQYVIKKIVEDFNEYFFNQPKDYVCNHYKKVVESYLGQEYDVSHIEALHDLGYLPLQIKSLPEGTLVPLRVPTLTIRNTHKDFFWLVNYLETLLSCMLWQPMTSATIAYEYRKNFEIWAKKTGSKADIIPGVLNNVDIQGHDFSMRGMGGPGSGILSGLGHALMFKGSDTLPVMEALEYAYFPGEEFKVCSIPATEHSVMCAGGDGENEFETFKRLITEIYPKSNVSIVSDTWDLWKVLTDYLPRLKKEILAREGKVVIRPDSGDPVDIICGLNSKKDFVSYDGKWIHYKDNRPYKAGTVTELGSESEIKGVIELLWDIFGGTTNEQGYKVLDPHIGAIYGDSITIDRAEEICKRLEAKGFASTNWVAGIGSYTYQYNTRDTFGFAMKATYVEVKGQARNIYKDPITDDGTKKSAKGLLYVQSRDGEYKLLDEVNKGLETQGDLKVIFNNGEFQSFESLKAIRDRIINTLEKDSSYALNLND